MTSPEVREIVDDSWWETQRLATGEELGDVAGFVRFGGFGGGEGWGVRMDYSLRYDIDRFGDFSDIM